MCLSLKSIGQQKKILERLQHISDGRPAYPYPPLRLAGAGDNKWFMSYNNVTVWSCNQSYDYLSNVNQNGNLICGLSRFTKCLADWNKSISRPVCSLGHIILAMSQNIFFYFIMYYAKQKISKYQFYSHWYDQNMYWTWLSSTYKASTLQRLSTLQDKY